MSTEKPPKSFRFEVEAAGTTRVVSIGGWLSEDSNRDAKEKFLAALRGEPRHLVVDLARLDYISSSGIAVLVAILGRCRQASIQLLLCGLNPDILEIFQITRLNQVFQIHPDRRAALAALGDPA